MTGSDLLVVRGGCFGLPRESTWPNVLVHREHVGRVPAPFEGYQSLVLFGSERRADPRVVDVVHEVEGHPGHGPWPQRIFGGPGPRDGPSLVGLGPDGVAVEQP